MTYEEALRFWFGRVNYEQRSPRRDDLHLGRMRALLSLLGEPQHRLRIVHIAGTKGKGSTAALLAAVLRRAGYRTGLFTSPHLSRVEERIQLDGVPVSPAELAVLMADVRPAVERLDAARAPGSIGVTFFEIATALGFLHFVRHRADVAVVEVGLGGRFDATNVCRPLVSLITSISHDHTEQLGNTLASIAFEKAGIVKPGRPVLSGVRPAEARAVIERVCRQRGAPLRQVDVDYSYAYSAGRVLNGGARTRVRVRTWRRDWPEMEVGLLGEHQAANAALAVTAVEVLREAGLHVPDAAVAAGLAGVEWPARLEVVGRRPLAVLDCAHNVASAQALLDALLTSFPGRGRRLLVFAGSADKDIAGMLRVLAPHFAGAYLTRFGSARAVPPERLGELWLVAGGGPHALFPDPAAAWQAALADARPEDLICATGSVFLAGELRTLRFDSGPILADRQP
jgi:dihydrofolate synthase/folylpolyglutamate synthase